MRALCVFSCLCLSMGLLAAPVRARPNTTDAPVIVVTPTRTPTELERLPVTTTVIDRAAFERQGAMDVREALSAQAGANLVSNGGPAGTTTLFLRGTEAAHTLVLLDGIPINDPSGATGAFNFGSDFLGAIERLEIMRGPASVLYGSQAVGGVVNLITRTPSTESLAVNGQMAAGSYGTITGSAGFSGRQGAFDYLTQVEGIQSSGHNLVPKRLYGTVGEKDGYESYSLFTRLGVKLGDATRLRGQIRWRDMAMDLDDEARDDPNYQGSDQMLSWMLRGEQDMWQGRITSSLTLGQNLISRHYHNDPDAFSAASPSSSLDALYRGERLTLAWQNTAKLANAGIARDIVLTGGVDTAYDFTHVRYGSDGLYGPFTQTVRASAMQTGIYAQIQSRLAERVDITAGLRRDMPDSYDDRTTYRVGAVFHAPEIQSRIKGALGTSYRTPSLFERFGVDNYGTVGNPDLEAERARSWEAGFETDVPLFDTPRFATIGTTHFATTTRDLIQYVFSSPPQYQNVGKVEISGFESSLTVRPFAWLEGRGTWTWTKAVNASGVTAASTPDGKQLLRRPVNTLTFDATLWPVPAWSVSPQIVVTGDFYDQTYDDNGTFLGRARVGGFTLVNLGTTYQMTDHITLFARARNLLDRRLETPNGFMQPGFNALAGVKAAF